jgi:hypothetical protein
MGDNVDKVFALAGTLVWTDAGGNYKSWVTTDEQAADYKAKGVEYVLVKDGQVVGYEYNDQADAHDIKVIPTDD